MSLLATVYCTDEDLLVFAPADFAAITPRHQMVAQAADGVVAGWTLSGATDYAAAGVAPGMVVQFLRSLAATDGQPRDLLVVAAASGTTLTLRRPGQPAGVGAPPLVATPTGVAHQVATLAPQAEEASWDLDRRFGIREDVPGRRPADLADARDLRRACVLTVYRDLYASQARQSGSNADDYAAKARACEGRLSDLLARLTVRWAAPAIGDPGPTNRFGTRLSR